MGGEVALTDWDYVRSQEYEKLVAEVDVLTQKLEQLEKLIDMFSDCAAEIIDADDCSEPYFDETRGKPNSSD